MIYIDIYDAKRRLSKLVDAVTHGQQFIIMDSGRPIARLLPIEKDKAHRIPGSMKGKIKIADDFDSPMSISSQN